ncbi:hypothetical protein [uncultured Kordia sp.]|uniref:hypothetical protein n=1 Tax=uncultured Kordia sp. TaxID=507699 RepID=UPI00260FC128|nr:hypothetical protein [uncultured Kordia sp.]
MQITTTWNLFEKIGFRFLFIYFLLFTLPFPLDIFEYLSKITKFYDDVTWKKIIPFVSENIFNIPYDTLALPLGSGDTTYNYIQLFCFIIITVLITIIWSILDRKRKNYKRLLQYFIIYIAYYLIYIMFVYGFIKVYKLQFPDPRLSRLLQPYGNSSPMGIAWTFMGASKGYTFFSGLSEIIAGLLLIFRRTRTLGGLVCFGVMLNVFMMNMCYDIPVKIFSFHLLLLALFIFMQDWKRLLNIFFTTSSVPPRSFPKYFKKPVFNIGAIVLKTCLIGFFLYSNISNAIIRNEARGPSVKKPPMYGIYNITNIVQNQDTIPLLITNDTLWGKVVIQSDKYVLVYQMRGNFDRFELKLDTINHTMKLTQRFDSTNIYKFKYTLKDSILTLQGTHLKDTIRFEAKQYDLKKFQLMNRGFHWINEYPYNR